MAWPTKNLDLPLQSDSHPLHMFRLDLNSVNTEKGSPLVKITAYCDEVGT